MGMRLGIAQAIGSASAWGLQRVFHRPAANFPGKIGLYADPGLIADLRPRIGEGVIAVVGTNGKTTVTNLIADALEASGKKVACNRTGANLDSGVATALMQARGADWGVFECDELWLARIAAQLQPDYVVLLNLFRDQLDRMGEIVLIQESISHALASSPAATLMYNCDDPICQAIADGTGNASIPFGIAESMGQALDTVSDTDMCQRCDAPLEYEWRQYGQLGSYSCPQCGFSRPAPAYTAGDIRIGHDGTRLALRGGAVDLQLDEPFTGAYMVYNVLAAYAASDRSGVPFAAFERAVRMFDPQNGRLQQYEIDGRRVILNLAKNPTGFNQNLRIVMEDPGSKAAAFFINDKEADGHDVSWLWDVDFQELAWASDLTAFAGGMRRNDTQVRLKHAGVEAQLVDGARDFLAKAWSADPEATCYLIANYTALPLVKAELDRLRDMGNAGRAVESRQREGHGPGTTNAPKAHAIHAPNGPHPAYGPHGPHPVRGPLDLIIRQHLPQPANRAGSTPQSSSTMQAAREAHCNRQPACPLKRVSTIERPEKLNIVHLYPTLLNLYGDGGNATVLANRIRWRGMGVEVTRIGIEQEVDLSDADIVFLGGGPDREQLLASRELLSQADAVRDYVEDDGVLLAICGGFQILGREWVMGGGSVPGLGVIDAVTKRADGNARNRLVGNIALKSTLANMPVIGYENHAGRTYIGRDCEPFGSVIGKRGHGNNDANSADGILYRNVVGTYLHGPLLAKNPEVADALIERALARRAAKEGRLAPALSPLADAEERAANAFMRRKLGLKA